MTFFVGSIVSDAETQYHSPANDPHMGVMDMDKHKAGRTTGLTYLVLPCSFSLHDQQPIADV